MRAILNDDPVANEMGVLSENLSTGTSASPCVAEIGAIASSGVKRTASEYSAMPADLVVNGGTFDKTTTLGAKTENETVPATWAPKVTCSPGSSTPLLFKSR